LPTSTSPEAPDPQRRSLLAALLAALASSLPGCAEKPPPLPPTEAPPPPPLVIPTLEGLLPLAGLRWLVLTKPREITKIPWLIPAIAAFIPESRFDRFAKVTGIDLRKTPEAIVASYTTEEGDASIELVRHAGDARAIERAFRDRISSDVIRAVDRPDLVRVTGRIGREPHGFAALGNDVVCFQQEGSMKRGPCRIASLIALGKLGRLAKVAGEPVLESLAARLGPAPLRVFALGPFEGELARGARGLAGAATAIGAAARPSAREAILLSIVITGDFTSQADLAAHELELAWADLVARPFGHLCGLDAPVAPPLATHAADAVTLQVELEPRKLAKGLADATVNEIDAIMR
jgi:hypothetical protein